MGVDAHLSDLQNRIAAGIFQRFQNTLSVFCGDWGRASTSRNSPFPLMRKWAVLAYVLQMHCLPLLYKIGYNYNT